MNETPYEAWRGRKPRVSHLRIFGCIAYALVNSHHKLDEKSKKCIFVGYCTQSKAYRLYNPLSGKIIVSRNVVFNEDAKWDWTKFIKSDQAPVIENEAADFCEPTDSSPSNDVADFSSSNSASSNSSSPASTKSSSPISTSSSSTETSPRKMRSLKEIYETCSFALNVSDPIFYKEAATMEEWKIAMNEEMASIQKNQTWELVDLPKERMLLSQMDFQNQVSC